MIGRRGFITGLVSLVAAPAIVRAGSLMPVKVHQFNPADVEEMLIDYAMRQVNPIGRAVDDIYGVSPMLQALSWLRTDQAKFRYEASTRLPQIGAAFAAFDVARS